MVSTIAPVMHPGIPFLLIYFIVASNCNLPLKIVNTDIYSHNFTFPLIFPSVSMENESNNSVISAWKKFRHSSNDTGFYPFEKLKYNFLYCDYHGIKNQAMAF